MYGGRTAAGLALLVGLSGATGVVASVACSGNEQPDAFEPELPPSNNSPRDSGGGGTDEEVDSAPPVIEDPDAGDPVEDAGGDASPCMGKANGFAWKGDASPLDRCCDQKPVRFNTKANCGTCGIQCNSQCVELPNAPGQWACRCNNSNQECVNLGYGLDGKCFNAGQGDICQCDCQAGTTCAGQCKAGATCHIVTQHNYCAYP